MRPCVHRAIECVERFAPGDNLQAEELGLAVRLGVGDEDPLGQRGDDAVALVRSFNGGAFD
jgi:hypothetical protein